MSDTDSQPRPPWHLFDVFGVELEYMIVDQATLNVLPVTDRLIAAEAGQIESEIDLGELSWSNELALHVVELKTTQPSPALPGLARTFQEHVERINRRLNALGGRLMPTAMHPWMDPIREMKLWPHEYSPVYEAFNRIFDCRGHGWANLQSVHLNLPFCGDEEFGRLHAAVRLVLPLLPGIAAASPVVDGQLTGLMDNRLEVYRRNSQRIPRVAGQIIPEPAFSQADYQQTILEPLYRDIAPLDPDGVLQEEFLNARGAIARFGRGSIEIRVIDVQECPAADLSVLQLLVATLQALTEERWSSTADQKQVGVLSLHRLLLAAIRDADQTMVDDTQLLAHFGLASQNPCTLQQLWTHLAESLQPRWEPACAEAMEVILRDGPLARRIARRIGPATSDPDTLRAVWNELADCLRDARVFHH